MSAATPGAIRVTGIHHHAIERFAERSGIGEHRHEYARQTLERILERSRLEPLGAGACGPRIAARSSRYGTIVLGISTTGAITTTISVSNSQSDTKRTKTKRQKPKPPLRRYRQITDG